LRDANAVIGFDDAGLAVGLSSSNANPLDITVPKKTAKKQLLHSDVIKERVSPIRIRGKQYQL